MGSVCLSVCAQCQGGALLSGGGLAVGSVSLSVHSDYAAGMEAGPGGHEEQMPVRRVAGFHSKR